MLFAEIDHHNIFSTNIFSGNKSKVSFHSINNLFHPSTVDGSFVQNQKGIVPNNTFENPKKMSV
jgi:hypothetical protein